MHETMRNVLGSLYTCSRGLLQRRWWKLRVIVRNFFMVKFPEVLSITMYMGKPYNEELTMGVSMYMGEGI
jgi:hypothetical protein